MKPCPPTERPLAAERRPRKRRLLVTLVLCGLLGAGDALAMTGSARESAAAAMAAIQGAVNEATIAAPPAKPAKEPPFIDQNIAFYGCFSGVSLGALLSALPPVAGWITYIGAAMGFPSMMLRMGMGCWFGLMGGVAASATASTVRKVGEAWNRWF
jgi:hypothetical protein